MLQSKSDGTIPQRTVGGVQGAQLATQMGTCPKPCPRDPSGNPARSAEGSRDVIRVVVYALYRLRPNGLGASEDSGPDDEKGAQKASFGASCGLGAGDCRWLRLPLTVSHHQAQVRHDRR